jgi:hypothetical protein
VYETANTGDGKMVKIKIVGDDKVLRASIEGSIRYRMKVTQRKILAMSGRKQCGVCDEVYSTKNCRPCGRRNSKNKYSKNKHSINKKQSERFQTNLKHRYRRFAYAQKIKGFPVKCGLEVYIFHSEKTNCDSCGKSQEENGKRLAIDHCHDTGLIRGALCCGCNKAEGHAGGIEGLYKLITYLESKTSE